MYVMRRDEASRVTMSLIALILLALCPGIDSACNPVEEGHPTTLTCKFHRARCSSLDPLIWLAGRSAAVRCIGSTCESSYGASVSGSVSSTRSKLTLSNVSRSEPFSMETRWTCEPCRGRSLTVCGKMQIYTKPENVHCGVSETPGFGHVTSVMIYCSTIKVYPQAKCSFYRRTCGGNQTKITGSPTYTHPETEGSPVYYRSVCSISVPVEELGEGTHTFQGYIYPDVTDGENLVSAGLEAEEKVTLSLPQASHRCSPDIAQGHYLGNTTRCTCSLTSDGYPRGRAQWYKGDQALTVESDGALVVTFNNSEPEQIYTCEGVSALGRKIGSTLTDKFPFFHQESPEIESSLSIVNLCDNNNSNNNNSFNNNENSNNNNSNINQAVVTCRVLRENVSPEPTFSFSLDGQTFDTPQPGTLVGGHYQRKLCARPAVGGDYHVTCRVTNTVLNTQQEQWTRVIFRKPPSLPPKITVRGHTYLGDHTSNVVTLTEGDSGDISCHVVGAFPDAQNTRLQCGQLTASGGGGEATLRLQADQLTRDMDGTVCTCSSQHVSGCYGHNKTTLRLNVTYAPTVHFTTDSPTSTLRERGQIQFTCFVQGNPGPTSVVLTRGRDGETLGSVDTADQRAELTHILGPLSCVDTGVYVCSGQNSQGITRKKIKISVISPSTEEESQSKGDNLNLPAVIISVIAVVIIVAFIVLVVFLVEKIRVLRRGMKTGYKVSPVIQGAPESGYLIPMDIYPVTDAQPASPSTALDTVHHGNGHTIPCTEALSDWTRFSTDINHYESYGDSPVTDLAPVPTLNLPDVARQESRTSSAGSTTTPKVIIHAPETSHYESIDDIASACQPYDLHLPQDPEPPNLYCRPRPVASPVGKRLKSGPYINIPERDRGKPDTALKSEPPIDPVT